MNNEKLSRRSFATTAATGLAALGLLGVTVKSASAYQGNMERALNQLQDALQSLQESTPNKGGHRERAMNLVRQAMAETQAGVTFAAEHGGEAVDRMYTGAPLGAHWFFLLYQGGP